MNNLTWIIRDKVEYGMSLLLSNKTNLSNLSPRKDFL